jgi:hypothetical protein
MRTPALRFIVACLSILVACSHQGLVQQAGLGEAEALNRQVVQLYNQGRYGEAIPLAEKALAIWEKALGPDHPDVAPSLNNLSLLCTSLGDYPSAPAGGSFADAGGEGSLRPGPSLLLGRVRVPGGAVRAASFHHQVE